LAAEYIQLRGIPEKQLIALDLPTGETLSRGFYESKLRDPLLEQLRKEGLIEQTQRNPDTVSNHESGWTTVRSSLRFVVSMYGVPLRIADTRWHILARLAHRLDGSTLADGAAVDSELVLLLADPYSIKNRIPNPMYSMMRWNDLSPAGRKLLMAARLDGPDPATVRSMMSGALHAEQYGLNGRAYFDTRDLHDDDYFSGDIWLREAAERFAREGFECTVDRSDDVWDALFPMDHAAIYFGWYAERVTGPFAQPDFRFAPGAVAYHLHSANAKTLRSSTDFWVGPLLSRGASVSMGSVDEPYLSSTPDLHIFADRLCSGYSLGESAWMSIPFLSWQMTVAGDPLYRPFKLSLDDQIKNLERDKLPEVEWAYLRRVNQFVRDGRFNVAMDFCRAKIETRESIVLRERLGDLYAMNELYDDAMKQYAYVIVNAETPQTALRAGVRDLRMLRVLGRNEQAANVEQMIRDRWKDSPYLALLKLAHP
jgi:uncharacterized protein (TIGR03790 family)